MKILMTALMILSAVAANAGSEEAFKQNRKDVAGSRDFRPVLLDMVYRAGSNANSGDRSNDALTGSQLRALCESGVENAIYLYGKKSTSDVIQCNAGTLRYDHMRFSGKNIYNILGVIKDSLDQGKRTVFHCWNGVHATGVIAATALMQFCDYSAEDALKYFWIGMGDVCTGEKNQHLITGFQPDDSLRLSPSVQAQVCPDPSYLHAIQKTKIANCGR